MFFCSLNFPFRPSIYTIRLRGNVIGSDNDKECRWHDLLQVLESENKFFYVQWMYYIVVLLQKWTYGWRIKYLVGISLIWTP